MALYRLILTICTLLSTVAHAEKCSQEGEQLTQGLQTHLRLTPGVAEMTSSTQTRRARSRVIPAEANPAPRPLLVDE